MMMPSLRALAGVSASFRCILMSILGSMTSKLDIVSYISNSGLHNIYMPLKSAMAPKISSVTSSS